VRFLSWLAVNAVALAVVLWAIPGIHLEGPSTGTDEIRHKLLPLLVVAVILGAVSAVIKPVLTILSLPLIILTLGLFLLVVNAALFGITAALSSHLNINGFWPAVLGGTIVAIFSWIAEQVLPIRQREWERRRRW
jgi:putative membrane protein